MSETYPWMRLPETQTLVKAFAAAKADMRFVGGCVRDGILGLSVADIDVATPHLPEAVTTLLETAHIKAIPTGIDHGTVTALIKGRHFEITTLRNDVSTDGRHAEVSYTDDWKEDAARRDFTINALYLSPSGELFDYFGGQADLKEGRVRFIGDAAKRISEDYLRILRFFRFHARFGKGAPDADGLAACKAAAAHIDQLSGERIQQEMMKLLQLPNSYPTVKVMKETGILEHALGAKIEGLQPLANLEKQSPSATPLQKLAVLADNPKALSARLKLSNADSRELDLLAATKISVQATSPEQREMLRSLGAALFERVVSVNAARANALPDYEPMLKLAREWSIPAFPVTGKDLQGIGFKEGKQMGELLKKLEESWVKSDYKLSREQLLAQAKA